jgi:hypothetical protein
MNAAPEPTYEQFLESAERVRLENLRIGLLENVRLNPGWPFHPDRLKAFAQLRREDPPTWHFYRGCLDQARVPVRDLDRALDELDQKQGANGEIPLGGVRSFYWTLEDIKALEPPTWLIEGLMARRAKALIFGESGHYKTMHAVDALCRVAHGMDYHGLEVGASFPVVFIANEDAYGLAVQRVQGWHLYHGKPSGRVIVLPCNTRLDQPDDVARAIACARDAFGDERPIFVIDTWDRSISGNPNSTEDVNPALSGLDALLAVGELTVTISHSPWSDKNRTKGAVTFWANHDCRIKAEKDEATGRGVLKLIHQKNARAGMELGFEFEQFDFEHRGEPTNTLIPLRDFDYQPERKSPDAGMGSRQKAMMGMLANSFARNPDGVDRGQLRSSFILSLTTEHERAGKPHPTAAHCRSAFNQTFDALRKKGRITGPDDALRPSE